MHFTRRASGESETANQAVKAVKTTLAFHSTGVSSERNYGGFKPKPRLDQIQIRS